MSACPNCFHEESGQQQGWRYCAKCGARWHEEGDEGMMALTPHEALPEIDAELT